MTDNELRQALSGLLLDEPTHGVDVERALAAGRSAHRARRLKVGLSCLLTVVVVGVGLPLASSKLSNHADIAPVDTPGPGLVVGAVPVWYDARGLHRGDVVEQTPVPVGTVFQDMGGALALVRSGALYVARSSGDVWFHPWGGVPRVVGRHSTTGPGGDPSGDTAAWFERSELVVYDTAAGREIARATPPGSARYCAPTCGEHYEAGNTFLQVSAERVVWNGGPSTVAVTYDVRTGASTLNEVAVTDMHDGVTVFTDLPTGGRSVILSAPDRDDTRLPDLEPRARLSPSGDYLLAIEGQHGGTHHGAVIIDIGTGETWYPAAEGYHWISWSYGDLALIHTEEELLACDAARRTCESLPVERQFLMPTN